MITAVDINLNGHWTWEGKYPEVEVGIVDNDRNRFILTYGT